MNAQTRSLPTTVVSTTLEGPLDWPNAPLVSGDAADVVTRPKDESGMPLRSHGSLSMNRALMMAGVAGEGIRLFDDDPKSYRLDLVSSTEFSNGTVALHYRRHR